MLYGNANAGWKPPPMALGTVQMASPKAEGFSGIMPATGCLVSQKQLGFVRTLKRSCGVFIKVSFTLETQAKDELFLR
ncbi:hypothetical protein V6N11_042415 [Hibiscus sabdariffa]|uniref:Uncharacterized protein n=1 Tax=Hibiscus sabdariffa TaxID=183260 RepID=A0ABR2QW92_9ROSI